MTPLNLFFEQYRADRWIKGDRYPRRFLRQLLRGPDPVGGQERVFINLLAGLRRIGIPYTVNDYDHARRHPEKVACVIGQPHVLNKMKWQNPLMFGAAVYSHASDDPTLLQRLPVKRILVPGEWMATMCRDSWGDLVRAWPVGIVTDLWKPTGEPKFYDVLLYDKIRWEHDRFEKELLTPIRQFLARKNLRVASIRYGAYKEQDYHSLLRQSRTMLFLCEHETQGIAYQQCLSAGVPILAWDRGGFWQDPAYYPHRVRFQPVTSVPYWDSRCGLRFEDYADFERKLPDFLQGTSEGRFAPRDYILENLTLEKCAQRYVDFWKEIQ